MKQVKFSADNIAYEMFYDCPDQEMGTQIQEIFSNKDYKLAQRKKDMVVLDIGANVGMFSLFIKPYARKIYAVEPSKRIFTCLKENTKNWDNIEIFNVGFFNNKGKNFLYGKGEETPQTMMIPGEHTEAVDTVTIEEFMNENKIDHIDVLKMDTEGSEYIIFADESFRRIADRIDYIIGESHHVMGALPKHIIPILAKANFKARLLPRKNYSVYLNYQNSQTGQKEIFQVKENSLFVAERNYA